MKLQLIQMVSKNNFDTHAAVKFLIKQENANLNHLI